MKRLTKSNQSGFTLIELTVVVVMLGILAAIAVPRFIDAGKDTRTAALNGMAGAVEGAIVLAKTAYRLQGNPAATSVTMDGQSVDVAAGTGVPDGSATGMEVAVETSGGFSAASVGGVTTFTLNSITNCQVDYDESGPTVTVTSTGC